MRNFSFIIALLFLIVNTIDAKKIKPFVDNNSSFIKDSSISVLLLPTDSINIKYFDNTKIHPDTQFTDSFFLESSNDLFFFEASKKYRRLIKPDTLDTIFSSSVKGYSKILNIGDEKVTGEAIKKIATLKNADAVLLLYGVEMRHITSQPEGWRSSPEYQKPVSYKAISRVHIQLWSSDGKLVADIITKTDTGRPFMYSVFQSKQKDRDIAAFSKRLYAPPVVRSLSKAIAKSLKF